MNTLLKTVSVCALFALTACGGGLGGSFGGGSGNSSAGGSSAGGSSSAGGNGSFGLGGRQNPQVTEAQQLEQLPPQDIFLLAENSLAERDYEEAARLFGEIERLYPFSEFARRALIMSAFANHRDNNYVASRSDAQRFLDFYPADKDAAYAQYLIALSYYDQIDTNSRDSALILSAVTSIHSRISGAGIGSPV